MLPLAIIIFVPMLKLAATACVVRGTKRLDPLRAFLENREQPVVFKA
jgi:hypothetical protein